MKKALVVLSHPNMAHSSLNKQVLDELQRQPERFTIHNLYEEYPDEQIDVAAEQALIEAHEGLVLQFPVYWYSCPSLMKKWLDEVFEYNWAYGPSGNALHDKSVGLIVTTGADESSYQAEGETMSDILTPFRMTFKYTNSHFKGFFSIYGPTTTPETVQSAVSFLHNL